MTLGSFLLKEPCTMRKPLATLGVMISLVLPSVVLADFATDPAGSSGLTSTAKGAFGDTITSQASLPTFIGSYILQPIFGLVGLGFLCLTVYAGVLWMTARGETKQITKAKDILVTSIIGAVIILASYTLTTAVFNAITKGNVT